MVKGLREATPTTTHVLLLDLSNTVVNACSSSAKKRVVVFNIY
jgi:hypothetical protein